MAIEQGALSPTAPVFPTVTKPVFPSVGKSSDNPPDAPLSTITGLTGPLPVQPAQGLADRWYGGSATLTGLTPQDNAEVMQWASNYANRMFAFNALPTAVEKIAGPALQGLVNRDVLVRPILKTFGVSNLGQGAARFVDTMIRGGTATGIPALNFNVSEWFKPVDPGLIRQTKSFDFTQR